MENLYVKGIDKCLQYLEQYLAGFLAQYPLLFPKVLLCPALCATNFPCIDVRAFRLSKASPRTQQDSTSSRAR